MAASSALPRNGPTTIIGQPRRSTNSIESFWHPFKYSVHSTYIQIGREKLPLYLAEFC
jgi:hypothetical protein